MQKLDQINCTVVYGCKISLTVKFLIPISGLNCSIRKRLNHTSMVDFLNVEFAKRSPLLRKRLWGMFRCEGAIDRTKKMAICTFNDNPLHVVNIVPSWIIGR